MSVDSSKGNSDSLQSENAIALPSTDAGEIFVRTLRDHPAFCYWCLCPLVVNPVVQFTDGGPSAPLQTGETYAEYGNPVEDVPPDRTNGQGVVVETSRDEKTICGSCGVIDVDAKDSRTKETTRQALTHVCSILSENDTDVDRFEAMKTVDEAFDKGHTGQFVKTLGEAVYRATD